MSLTAKLALQQLRNSYRRTAMTLFGIVLAVGMLVAIGGYGASGAYAVSNMIAEIYGEAEGEGWASVIQSFAVFFGIIVSATAIIVVSNAFRVSVGERIRQFGILKSVGASKRQIRATVIYEGIFLSLIGLPAGFVAGLIMQYVATVITNSLMGDVSNQLSFGIYPGLAAISLAGAFAVVLFSAWLPARKAAKISAINAIKGSFNTKAKPKNPKTLRIINNIFGFEGVLATKQLKRNRRYFRATVISLCISIVLILASGSLRTHMGVILDGRMAQMGDMNAAIQFFTPFPEASEMNFISAMEITRILSEFTDVDLGLHATKSYSLLGSDAALRAHGLSDLTNLIVFEPELYARLAHLANVPIGSNIIVNVALEMDSAGNFIQHNPFGDRTGEVIMLYPFEYTLGANGESYSITGIMNDPQGIEIHGQITHLPDDMLLLADFTGNIIVPELYATNYFWQIAAADPASFLEHAEYVVNQQVTLHRGEILVTLNVLDELVMSVAFVDFMSAFTFIFSGMIALLGLTNVISTIATSIQMRSKEFAVLSSVGMDRKGIRRMLGLESLLSSTRALLIGLPIGIITAYLVYMGVDTLPFAPFTIPFNIPWLLVVACSVGVFAITYMIMLFSAAGLKNGNIMESIRGVE